MEREEIACHALGERRLNYLNQIRWILDQMEDTPCTRVCTTSAKPLIEYPGYINRKNPKFKECPWGGQPQSAYQPMIVSLPIKELRPTSEYWKHEHENDLTLQYYPVGRMEPPSSDPCGRPRSNSFQLVGGEFIRGCDTVKRNGLQDECWRSSHEGNTDCLTTMTCDKEVPIEKKFQDIIDSLPPPGMGKPMYKCCGGHYTQCAPNEGPVCPPPPPRHDC